MRSTSIRLRLITVAALSILATLAVGGLSLVSVFERQILRRVEQELETRWTELAAAFTLDAAGKPMLDRGLTDPRYQRAYSGAYWQVTEGDDVALASRSLWDEKLDAEGILDTYPGSQAIEIAGPNESTLYLIDRRVTLAGSRDFDLAVAVDHAEVDALRSAFAWDVVRILGPIAVILMIAAWFQIRHSLRPLRDLDEQLKAVHDGERPRLGAGFASEVEPVVSDLNRLLDRQEQLIKKARDRAGALAHGLKTPLTIVGAEARRLDKLGLAEIGAKIAAQIDLIRRHVDRELTRASSAGASAAAGTFTLAGETVGRLMRLMQHLPRGEELVFENKMPPALTVRIDPFDFSEVIGNLLDNARKWADARIVVRAEPDERSARIVVEDDGPGFDPSLRRIGAEPARSPAIEADSTGLGLGIVRDILSEYGIALDVAYEDGWCRVSFVAPTGEEGRSLRASLSAGPKSAGASVFEDA